MPGMNSMTYVSTSRALVGFTTQVLRSSGSPVKIPLKQNEFYRKLRLPTYFADLM